MKRLLLVPFVFFSLTVTAQDFVEDLLDMFEVHLNKQKTQQDSTLYPAKLVLAPVISYEPVTSWGAGVGAKILFKFKNSGEETRTSNLPISALYTLNNQIILNSGYTIFFNQEKWILTGNIGYSKFPLSYYGIGNLTPEANEETFSFTNYLIEPVLLKKIKSKFFLGVGIRYNIITDTELESESQLKIDKPSGYRGSRSAGLDLVAVWDNRDNVLNATKGSFVQFRQGFYGEHVGGTHAFRYNQFDARTYLKPFKNRTDILAMQLFSRFAWGDVPISELSLIGGIESARGYTEGRYRDLNVISSQIEYRWHAWENIGFVAFTGVGDVFNDFGEIQFNNLKYSAGVGIRFKIVKAENLNIRFDYGWGFGHKASSGYYLGIAEAF